MNHFHQRLRARSRCFVEDYNNAQRCPRLSLSLPLVFSGQWEKGLLSTSPHVVHNTVYENTSLYVIVGPEHLTAHKQCMLAQAGACLCRAECAGTG